MRNIEHMSTLLCILVIGSTFFLLGVTGVNIERLDTETHNHTFFLDEDADLPVWEEGNFWEYNIDILYDAETVVIDISMENILFEVTEVNSESYILVFHGVITGSVNLANIVSGNLINTEIDGNIHIRKSDLAVNKISDVVVDGEIHRQLVTNSFHAAIEINQNVTPVLSPYNFPITVDETWTVPNMTFWVYLYAHVNLAIPFERTFSFPLVIREHMLSCITKETLIGPYGAFNDSFSVTGGESQYTFWYSPSAHNILRAEQKNIIIWHNETPYVLIDNIDIELQNTTFPPTNVPPDTPQKPSGTTSGEIGTLYPYTSQTMDKDGDQIYYLFDWGDGTQSEWIGPYPSGQMVIVEKEWNAQGTFNLKVKAKDTQGLESTYSDPLIVSMPKNKATTMNPFIQRIIEIVQDRFPHILSFLSFIPLSQWGISPE